MTNYDEAGKRLPAPRIEVHETRHEADRWKVSWKQPNGRGRSKIIDSEAEARKFRELVIENGHGHPRPTVLRDNGLRHLTYDISGEFVLGIEEIVNSDTMDDAEKIKMLKMITQFV